MNSGITRITFIAELKSYWSALMGWRLT